MFAINYVRLYDDNRCLCFHSFTFISKDWHMRHSPRHKDISLEIVFHMSKTIISSIYKLGTYKDSFVAKNGLMVNTIKNKWL